MQDLIWILVWVVLIGGLFIWAWRAGQLARFTLYVQQTKEVTRGYVKGLTDGKGGSSMKEIKDMISNLQTQGGEFFELSEHLGRVRSTYDDLKVSYENALRDVDKELTYSNVVTHPIPADKKTYPVRWLIVVFSVGGTLLFSYLVILVLTKTKN